MCAMTACNGMWCEILLLELLMDIMTASNGMWYGDITRLGDHVKSTSTANNSVSSCCCWSSIAIVHCFREQTSR
jgi:hypothetical protein